MYVQLSILFTLGLGGACVSATITPRYGQLELEGDIAIADSAAGVSASNDLQGDLGLDEDDGVLGARADFKGGPSKLTLAFQSSSHEGNGTLVADISGGGFTITTGTDVATEFDLGLGEAFLTFDMIPGDTVDFGLGFGASVLDLEASITDVQAGSPTLGDSVDADQTLPVPVLCARLNVNAGSLDLEALLGGIGISYDGDKASFYDLDAFARWSFLGEKSGVQGALLLGYRLVDIDVEYEDDSDNQSVEADVRFAGPYFGLTLGI